MGFFNAAALLSGFLLLCVAFKFVLPAEPEKQSFSGEADT